MTGPRADLICYDVCFVRVLALFDSFTTLFETLQSFYQYPNGLKPRASSESASLHFSCRGLLGTDGGHIRLPCAFFYSITLVILSVLQSDIDFPKRRPIHRNYQHGPSYSTTCFEWADRCFARAPPLHASGS